MALGRPPKFENPEQFHRLFIKWKKTFTAESDEIPDVEGLCIYLDTSRQTLFEYEAKPDFTDTIKRAKDWIIYKKKQLAMKGKIPPAIYIFDAKNNAGYVDKTEQDITSGGDKIGGISEQQAEQLLKARAGRSTT